MDTSLICHLLCQKTWLENGSIEIGDLPNLKPPLEGDFPAMFGSKKMLL